MIHIVSGTQSADVKSVFDNLLKTKNSKSKVIEFPEKHIMHTLMLFNKTLDDVAESIKTGTDLYILSYSEHVLNAVRVYCAENRLGNLAQVHQVDDKNKDTVVFVDVNGRMSKWVKGVYDTWDYALDRLLGVDAV